MTSMSTRPFWPTASRMRCCQAAIRSWLSVRKVRMRLRSAWMIEL